MSDLELMLENIGERKPPLLLSRLVLLALLHQHHQFFSIAGYTTMLGFVVIFVFVSFGTAPCLLWSLGVIFRRNLQVDGWPKKILPTFAVRVTICFRFSTLFSLRVRIAKGLNTLVRVSARRRELVLGATLRNLPSGADSKNADKTRHFDTAC